MNHIFFINSWVYSSSIPPTMDDWVIHPHMLVIAINKKGKVFRCALNISSEKHKNVYKKIEKCDLFFNVERNRKYHIF